MVYGSAGWVQGCGVLGEEPSQVKLAGAEDALTIVQILVVVMLGKLVVIKIHVLFAKRSVHD